MPGGDGGRGGNEEIKGEFIVGKKAVSGNVEKQTEGILNQEDYATGDEDYESGPPVAKGLATTRPTIPASLRRGDLLSSTHRTGIGRNRPGITDQLPRSGRTRPPDRARERQIASLVASSGRSDETGGFYWGPQDTPTTEPTGVPMEISQPNLENLSPEVQLQALVDSFVPTPQFKEIMAELQGTGSEGQFKLILSFKSGQNVWVVDAQRQITGKIKAILRQLEARLKEKGFQKKTA